MIRFADEEAEDVRMSEEPSKEDPVELMPTDQNSTSAPALDQSMSSSEQVVLTAEVTDQSAEKPLTPEEKDEAPEPVRTEDAIDPMELDGTTEDAANEDEAHTANYDLPEQDVDMNDAQEAGQDEERVSVENTIQSPFLSTQEVPAVMDAAAKQGQLEVDESWFSKMKQANVSADQVTYSIMMSAAAKAKNLMAEERWFSQMLNEGLKPTTITINVLMNAAKEVQNMTMIENLYTQMIKLELNPDTFTFGIILAAVAREKDIEKAQRCSKRC